MGNDDFWTDRDGYYDENEEKADKWYAGAIWLGLFILFGALFAFEVYCNVSELWLKYNGHAITTEFTANKTYVSYTAENGKKYEYAVDGTCKHDGDTITLYYYGEDIGSATPMTWIGFTAAVYVFFGLLAALCLWRFLKIMLVKKHFSEEDVDNCQQVRSMLSRI